MACLGLSGGDRPAPLACGGARRAGPGADAPAPQARPWRRATGRSTWSATSVWAAIGAALDGRSPGSGSPCGWTAR
jgi:hypothetical protein